jgi:hypothetical protein
MDDRGCARRRIAANRRLASQRHGEARQENISRSRQVCAEK